MNKNIFKAHLEELLRQLSNEELPNSKEKKSRLLINTQIQIEMCNLVSSNFNKDYSKEKEFFSKVQEFVLLDEILQAIKYVSKELVKIIIDDSSIKEYV